MPVTNVSNGLTSGDQTSLTFSHTSDGNPLYVPLSWYVDAGGVDTIDRVTGVTFDGVALALGGTRHVPGQSMAWWVDFAPASGTHNIVITLSAAKRVSAGAVNMTGWPTTIAEHSFAAEGGYGVDVQPSVTVVSGNGHEVLDWLGFNNGAQTTSAGAGQTEKWSQDGLGGGIGAGHDQLSAGSLASASGASKVMSWTLSQTDDFWGLGAISWPTPAPVAFTDGDPGPLAMAALTDRTDTVLPFAAVDLNDPADYEGGYKAPLVLSLTRIRTALSDAFGQLEHAAFGVVLSDTARVLRGLLTDVTKKYLANAPLVVKTIADEARRLLADWHCEMAGFVEDFAPTEDLRFEFIGCDWLKTKLARKATAPEFWVPLLTRTDFPALPTALVNKAVPFWYGKMTDEIEGAPSIPADLYPRGTADPGWLGWGYDYQVGGSLNIATYYMYGTTITAGIESQVIAFELGITMDAGHLSFYLYVKTAVRPDLYRFYVCDDGAFNPFTNPLAGTFCRYLDVDPDDLVDNPYGPPNDLKYVLIDAETIGNDYQALVDDGGGGSLTTPKGAAPTLYVGELVTVNGLQSAFLVSRGAVKNITGVFVGGAVYAPGSSTDVDCPFLDDYSAVYGAPYLDINGRRYTIVFARGQVALNAISGAAPITVNVYGVETIGDTTGDLITSPVDISEHFERNFLAASAVPDTVWLTTTPTLAATGAPMIDDAAYYAANVALAARLGGGYECAGGVGVGGNTESALEILASLCVSGDFDRGTNRLGQRTVAVEPVEAPDEADVIRLTDVLDINDRSFSGGRRRLQTWWNIIPFVHTQDFNGRTQQGWYGSGTSIDAASVTNYQQERPMTSPREYRWIRQNTAQGQATLLDVVKRQRTRYRHPLRPVTLTVPYLVGAPAVLGSVLRIDHAEGFSASGWIDHDVRVTAIETDLDGLVRTFEGYDLQPMYDGLDDAVEPTLEAIAEEADVLANLQANVAEALAASGITELTGDVTAGPGSGFQAATIAADAVTNAKLANMAESTMKGRAAGAGTGNPTDLDPDDISAILDGAADPFIRTSAGGTGGGGIAFRGAKVRKSTDQTGADYTAGGAFIAWDTEDYDTDNFHDNATNNTRLTIPAGVTKVRISFQMVVDAITASVLTRVQLYKNGSVVDGGQDDVASDGARVINFSLDHAVTAGDYFQVKYEQTTDSSVTIIATRSAFMLTVLEGTGAIGITTVIRKTADESVTSSAVLQDDDHLQFSVNAGEVWFVEFFLYVRSLSATPQFAYAISTPAGSTVKTSQDNVLFSVAGESGDVDRFSATSASEPNTYGGSAGSGSGAAQLIRMPAMIVVGGTGGTVKLQWAQKTSNGTATTVQANSFAVTVRVA